MIAAIDLGNEDLLDPARLDAEAILLRFKAYVSLVFEGRAEMGWKPLWHLSNDGLWTFYSDGTALNSDEFGVDRPPGTKAILFNRFQRLVISTRYRELWEDRAQRLALRHAMLDILANDDEGCRRFARQLFHPELAMQPDRWPSEDEVIGELRQSSEQLDLFGQSDATEPTDNAVSEGGVTISPYNPGDLDISHSNAGLEVPSPTVSEIEAVASPIATLNSASEIDLAANPRVDTSDNAASVEEIPEIQIVQIGVILPSLPGNAPKGMTFALTAYKAELEKRGARPIMGILMNQHSIIDADYSSSDASEWLPSGLKAAFSDFFKYHQLLLQHFPFISERESVIARINVDESKASGDVLIKPFKAALEMATAAKNAGVATSDVVQFMQELKQGAESLASLPNDIPISESVIDHRNIKLATPKQRLIGTAIGFLERAYNLLGTSVTLGTATYPAFAQNLSNVLDMLKALIHIQ
ncbi:hypothetical protein [Sinorhizobium medicae]|uniref:hypothetical protein n=1 Tax=Sinorhizobium medicae TaxID=110321 RepID=UPI0012970019|nr:hypothetical protein [Sinorhizobium medicae]MDX0967326.1 hypothetical protein [Sinorhizobium medicae]MQV46304.1 hypothetical protein [Sinorhizobium medicae]MQV54035.1 hypothetical protein [Sinorhizobium medicae]MQV71674.1 hypothetical protein [Sinorhizobium medicae]